MSILSCIFDFIVFIPLFFRNFLPGTNNAKSTKGKSKPWFPIVYTQMGQSQTSTLQCAVSVPPQSQITANTEFRNWDVTLGRTQSAGWSIMYCPMVLWARLWFCVGEAKTTANLRAIQLPDLFLFCRGKHFLLVHRETNNKNNCC